MVNYKLLRNGGVYRLSYSTWVSNERPIVYLVHASPYKLHALSLNGPTVSTLDVKRFSYFVKLARATRGWETYSGRVVYRVLKTYFKELVRKTYRTYLTRNVLGYSLVNTGTVNPSTYTSYETAHTNYFLYNQSKLDLKLQELNRNTRSGYTPPKKPNVYNPQRVVVTPNVSTVSSTEPNVPGLQPGNVSDYTSIYDED